MQFISDILTETEKWFADSFFYYIHLYPKPAIFNQCHKLQVGYVAKKKVLKTSSRMKTKLKEYDKVLINLEKYIEGEFCIFRISV